MTAVGLFAGQRQRCLAICAKYSSVEGSAQKIADEIERGKS